MSLPNRQNSAVPDQTNGPTVRHIPIYVEGRDEPILNTSSSSTSSGTTNPSNSSHHHHHQQQGQPEFVQQNSGPGNSIFSRVKDFPVRSGSSSAFDSDFFQGRRSGSAGPRANSPRQNVPSNVSRRSTSPAAQVHKPTSTAAATPPSQTAQPSSTTAADSSIEKIQNIQRDVLALMDQVEQFTGTSKKDKSYMYLDEMLTQNLLKLDTIDTEGKENIKQARREAIKCINICIAALERKTEAAAATQGQQ